MLHHPVAEAVVGVHALVVALQPLPPLVPRNLQRDPIAGSELLELGHDAAGDDGRALGVEAVHHGGEELELVLDGVGEEVGVDQDRIGGLQGGVVLEEEGGWHLGAGGKEEG